MAKPTALTPEALTPATSSPTAATAPRGTMQKSPAAPKPMPLQVRLPREEVRAIKVAAAQREQTVSDFMLACFHVYMKTAEQ
jgi:hypothetical protein